LPYIGSGVAEETAMLKRIVVASALALALGLMAPSANSQMGFKGTPGLVGLPVYSSDGQSLGHVTSTFGSGGRSGVRAKVSGDLGFGPSMIFIEAHEFSEKPNRIELNITAAEFRRNMGMGRPPFGTPRAYRFEFPPSAN
jgi:hypothetical protein